MPSIDHFMTKPQNSKQATGKPCDIDIDIDLDVDSIDIDIDLDVIQPCPHFQKGCPCLLTLRFLLVHMAYWYVASWVLFAIDALYALMVMCWNTSVSWLCQLSWVLFRLHGVMI